MGFPVVTMHLSYTITGILGLNDFEFCGWNFLIWTIFGDHVAMSVLPIVDKYLVRPAEIVDLLRRLSAAGKKLFLITNSSAEFV